MKVGVGVGVYGVPFVSKLWISTLWEWSQLWVWRKGVFCSHGQQQPAVCLLYHTYVSIAKSLISSNLALTVNDVGKP